MPVKTPNPQPVSYAAGRAAPPSSSYVRWLWLGVLPLATVLRFLLLARRSLWLDEVASVGFARLNGHDFLRVLWQREANMTAFYLLLRPVLHLGDTEFWVRLPAVVAGVAAIPVMFALGETLFDRRLGLLAALLVSLNACHVAFSQEARGYSLAVLFTALSSLLFLKAVEAPSWRTWLLYAVVSAIAVYSHFFAGFVLMAQALSLLALPRRMAPWRSFLAAAVLTGVLIAPLAVVAVTRNEGQLDWVGKPSLLEVYHTAAFLAANGGKVSGDFLLVFCLMALVSAARRLIRQRRGLPPCAYWRQVFLWCWLLAPMLLTLAVSLWTPIFFHRFLIVCLPAWVLLVALGLSNLRPAPVLVALYSVMSLGAVVAYYYSRTPEDWRGATHYVLAHARAGDAVLIWRPYGQGAFGYYAEHCGAGAHPPVVNRGWAAVASGDYSRLWVLFYPASDAAVRTAAANLTTRYPVLQASSFPRIRVVLLSMNGKCCPNPDTAGSLALPADEKGISSQNTK